MSLSTRSLLWKNTFGANNKIRFGSLFRAVVIGQMGNNILPFRGGELLRVYSLSSSEQLSKSQCLSTIVVERVFDLVSFIILTVFVSIFIEIPIYLRSGLIIVCSVTVFALAFMIYIANAPTIANRMFGWAKIILPDNFKDTLQESFNQLVLGLTALNKLKTTLFIFILSFYYFRRW